MQEGYVDPVRQGFTKVRLARVSDVALDRLNELELLDRQHAGLFRDHGFLAAPDLATSVLLGSSFLMLTLLYWKAEALKS
jgi:hypothetical protein